jgi:hypothetical protein
MLYRLVLPDGTEVMAPESFDLCPPLHSVISAGRPPKDYIVQAEPPRFAKVDWFDKSTRWCATFVVKPAGAPIAPAVGGVVDVAALPAEHPLAEAPEPRVVEEPVPVQRPIGKNKRRR